MGVIVKIGETGVSHHYGWVDGGSFLRWGVITETGKMGIITKIGEMGVITETGMMGIITRTGETGGCHH